MFCLIKLLLSIIDLGKFVNIDKLSWQSSQAAFLNSFNSSIKLIKMTHSICDKLKTLLFITE